MKKIGGRMWPYVKAVLDRDDIQYNYEQDTGLVNAEASARRFKEAVEDAFCEIQFKKSGSVIPVYSLKTVKNPEKLKRLQKLNGTDSYVLLSKDIEKYYRDFI